jgi:iron complex transport system substrate-binding protein
MSPDVEILASLQADWILSPVSLQSDLQPKYEALGSDYAFLNLRSVKGMYQAISELGTLFGREEEAQALVEEFTDFYEGYQSEIQEKEAPTVMILMGLPGSYVIATEHSYVGSLVELAGGQNVYAGTDQEFLTVNTEDMKLKDPDIILCTSHILPDQVSAMFADEFQTNDIWQHFRAVQDGEVYALTHGLFGMSANFQYQEALQELQQIFYGDQVREETEK